MSTRRSRRSRFHPRYADTGGLPPLHAERFYAILGEEHTCDNVSRLLRSYVQSLKAPVVGAMRVTCSDEAEQENIEAFQRNFVRYLLPSLKFSSKSPFRAATLGGRYEWNSIRLAEDHYALAPGAEDWKVLVLKVSSHVSVEDGLDGEPRFGCAQRYGSESTYCGALVAVLNGSTLPFAQRLAEDLDFEEGDRLAALRDPQRVGLSHRTFFAAVVNARIQARRAMIDVQDHVAATPTLYLILPCVTFNRSGHDTEVVCGIYTADRRGETPHDEYCGLSSQPDDYRFQQHSGRLQLTDPHLHEPRPARNHRLLVREQWRDSGEWKTDEVRDRALTKALVQCSEVAQSRPVATAALKTLVAAAMATSPIPAAVLLFGEGLVHVHHASQAHRLARDARDDDIARLMLGELHGRIDALDPEHAQNLVQLLVEEYGG